MSVFPGRISQKLDVQGSLSVDQAKTLADENVSLGEQTSSGTGDSFAVAAGVVTFTDAGATFDADDVGQFITIAGATTGGNNGTFLIEEYVDANNIKYTNASAAAEAYTGNWSITQPYSLEDDLNFERTDRKLIKGTSNYYDDVPTFERPSAVGTDVPANLTNLAGKTLDAYTKVRNVQYAGIKLRPSIADGDGNALVSDETFTTTNYHFTSDDVNSFITLTDGTATGATGTYRIKTVTDGKTLELDGLAATGAGTVTWVLEGDLKGLLTSRGYADAVDRRGIPIADSGAYDETNYEATFTDVIDPATNVGILEEDGDRIYARSFGDEKDPNNTGTNEGTRFFAQLISGANTAGASDSSLEAISGRSGSAASLAGSNQNVSGLTGMGEADVGRYLSIWNLAADEAGHYEITAIVSATEVTVNRGSNFTADASGAIEWQVSRHSGTFDFYGGDRYLLSEYSETADRTTLISGVVADAELTQDISEIREILGVPDGATTLTLTNTGADYVWSDLTNPSDTSVEECLNGATITASLQALANAITASSVTRVIERLSAAVPKNTAHTLPGSNVYTLDGGNNGANLWVFWRKQLRDPGTVANGDDYAETSTTQITPYELIRQGDHINYFILQ